MVPFRGVWFLLLALPAALALALGRLPRSGGAARRTMAALGGFTVLFLAVYKTALWRDPAAPFCLWNELPLQPCNVAALLLAPAALTDSRTLKAFCFHFGAPFALLAFAMPVPGFEAAPLLSAAGLGYYGFHGLVLALSLGLGTSGLYRPKFRDLPGALLLLAGSAAAAHGVNCLLRASVFPAADYFFTFDPLGNPILGAAYALLPCPFLYELPLMTAAAGWGLLNTWLSGRLAGGKKEDPT